MNQNPTSVRQYVRARDQEDVGGGLAYFVELTEAGLAAGLERLGDTIAKRCQQWHADAEFDKLLICLLLSQMEGHSAKEVLSYCNIYLSEEMATPSERLQRSGTLDQTQIPHAHASKAPLGQNQGKPELDTPPLKDAANLSH